MSDFLRDRRRKQMQEMEAILPQVERELRRLPNVDHVIVGAKEVSGVATAEPAYQVYVRTKKRPEDLRPEENIPKQIEGHPTDVILIEEASFIEDDTDRYRPLCGGCQLVGSGTGTLGVVGVAMAGGLAPEGVPLMLTNNHVAPKLGSLVGQPDGACDCWCCICCEVGKVVDTQATSLIDAAIATISADVRYCNEILERGVIRGWTTATAMAPGDPVFKRGRTTRLTEGRFSVATATITPTGGAGTFINQIRVTSATAGTPFALGGDSGSVLVDSQNRVIGLLFASRLPAGTPSWGNLIENVRTTMKIDFPVIGTPGAIPLSAQLHDETPDLRKMFEPLRAKLMASEAGSEWWQIIERHRCEVGQLVRHNRATTTTWNRYEGPSFVSHFLKTVKDKSYRVPEEIGGMRLESLLLGMAATLKEHGSPELSQAIWRHYLQILESAGGCRTVEAFLDRICECPPTEVETNEFTDSEVPVG